MEEAIEWKVSHQEEAVPDKVSSDAVSEAVLALTALGYSNTEALRAVKKVENASEMDVEGILKAALKHIGF